MKDWFIWMPMAIFSCVLVFGFVHVMDRLIYGKDTTYEDEKRYQEWINAKQNTDMGMLRVGEGYERSKSSSMGQGLQRIEQYVETERRRIAETSNDRSGPTANIETVNGKVPFHRNA